jgi:hypothetical protein
MNIHLCLDSCTSERHRDARVGVRLRRVRVDAPAWGASASGYNRRSECIGVPITRVRVGVPLCVVTSIDSARSAPRLSMVARRARAARARGARQAHLLHEGEGTPRVARPVHALGGTVRRARRAAALRVCGGPGAALRCCACAAAPRAGLRRGPEPPGAAARLARRSASNTELAALPAAVDWPILKRL